MFQLQRMSLKCFLNLSLRSGTHGSDVWRVFQECLHQVWCQVEEVGRLIWSVRVVQDHTNFQWKLLSKNWPRKDHLGYVVESRMSVHGQGIRLNVCNLVIASFLSVSISIVFSGDIKKVHFFLLIFLFTQKEMNFLDITIKNNRNGRFSPQNRYNHLLANTTNISHPYSCCVQRFLCLCTLNLLFTTYPRWNCFFEPTWHQSW